MKYSISLFIAALIVCNQSTYADPQKELIRNLAAENSEALKTGNYARLIELTYPVVVLLSGGRDKMIEMFRSTTESMKAEGFTIQGADVYEPEEVVPWKDKHYAIVPMVVRVKVPTGTLYSKGFLIAISDDDGKNWTFIDGAGIVKEPGKEKEKLAMILPDFPPKLSLPARVKPVLLPD